jgi:hypothetical protein
MQATLNPNIWLLGLNVIILHISIPLAKLCSITIRLSKAVPSPCVALNGTNRDALVSYQPYLYFISAPSWPFHVNNILVTPDLIIAYSPFYN